MHCLRATDFQNIMLFKQNQKLLKFLMKKVTNDIVRYNEFSAALVSCLQKSSSPIETQVRPPYYYRFQLLKFPSN